ncbi:hypothetical protein D3C71_980940 [compost metagenome]
MPKPVPLPIGLVVKNGSKTRSTTSGGMPVPESETDTTAYSPAGMVGTSPSAAKTCEVRRINSPPSGIASRALIARFSSALSNWLLSRLARSGASLVAIWMRIFSPSVLRSRCWTDPTSALSSTVFESSDCRRENASKRWVKAAARWLEAVAASRKRSIPSMRPMSRRMRMMSSEERMPVSMLLKSWAMPPVNWPIASIFCDWRRAASLASRAAI